jgi:hypothetical protein
MMHAQDHISLSDLDLLVMDGQSLAGEKEERIGEVRAHLKVCQECSQAAKVHAALVRSRPHGVAGAVPGCPHPDAWLGLAAGLSPEQDATALASHAASCGPCAAQLRTATQYMNVPDADPQVQHLESSRPKWQEALARQLAGESVERHVEELRKRGKVLQFSRRLLGMGAIAAMLLAAVTTVGLKMYRGSSDDALLARAYNLQRRTELRLPGGDAVPLASMSRGGPLRAGPTELLRLQLLLRTTGIPQRGSSISPLR